MLFAPEAILRTWRKSDSFPMETLTKAWFYHQAGDGRQQGSIDDEGALSRVQMRQLF